MIARAIGIGVLGTAIVFALLAIMAVLPVIIIFLIITAVAYVVIQEKRSPQTKHKLSREPP